MAIPIFIVAGFLDAGKTTFIKDALQKDGFSEKRKTLVILCEEGEIELTKDLLDTYNAEAVVVNSSDELNEKFFTDIIDKTTPDRIILEMNCMWELNDLFIPEDLNLGQVISFIDFTTFAVYYNNMRQKFIDMIKFSDLVVFNRCNDLAALASYQTNLKFVNGAAQYVVMDENGVVKQAFEEPLPYDVDADIIEISDDDFGRWYIDTFDNPNRYRGKVVSFNAIVIMSKKLPKGTFIAGRHCMTCCAEDVQLYGHLCKNTINAKVKNKNWIHIVARIEFEYSDEYQEEEAVLYPEEIKVIPALKNPVLDLR